jgi:hypothetical protein
MTDTQNGRGLRVVPVVYHVFRQIRIGAVRHFLEEVAGDRSTAFSEPLFGKIFGCAFRSAFAIEDDPAQSGIGRE